jgi:PTH1 family peptidyl-tRNA hydrolase
MDGTQPSTFNLEDLSPALPDVRQARLRAKIDKPSTSLPATYLIVGLGNPGREYRGSRHNVGFMVLDRLAERLGVTFSRLESKALVTKAIALENRLVLAKPQTYMNLSGQAVGSLVRFYKVPLERLLVAYDEVDLPLGSLRLRPAGGSAGHNGMQSIIDKLGTQQFPRLRVGINRPPGRMEAADYVLQDFSKDESEVLEEALSRALEAVFVFMRDGIVAAMNQFNPQGTGEIG